jgi:DNA-binding response OmpR family regulator
MAESEKNKKVLIIEDEAPMLRALVTKFTNEGFEVVHAKDGEEGLNTALAEHPDIILLDVVMPKMDGITVLKKLRADEWGRNVPVIVLTNISDTQVVGEALGLQAYDFLVKSDWKLSDVVAKVKEKLAVA